MRNKFDRSVAGGVFQAQIVSLPRGEPVLSSIDSADIIVVEHTSILDYFDVLTTVKPGARCFWSTTRTSLAPSKLTS